MERRKKGSGQITFVDEPTRKSKWKATATDSRGKRKTRYFKTEKEAKAFLRDINASANKLKALMESNITFSSFAPIFLTDKQKSMKPRSFETLSQNVARVEPLIGAIPLRDIDSDCVQQMIYNLADKGYSESILDKSKFAISAVLDMAASKHFLDAVPTLNITIPAQPRRENEKQAKNNWLKKNELAAYEQECIRTYVPQKYTKHAGKTLLVHPSGRKLLFLAHTGIRLGEGLPLEWKDYDGYSKTILIDKNVIYIDGKKVIQDPKTYAGERVIVLNKRAVEDLIHLKAQFDEQTADIESRQKEALRQAELKYSGQALKAAKKEINDRFDAIFREHKYICGSTTFPYGMSGHSSTRQTHDKICKKIGLSHKVTVHGLRHTYVTHYYLNHKNDSDFDLATFSKSIGHSSIRTTMEVYAHLDMTENRHIQRSVDDLKDF